MQLMYDKAKPLYVSDIGGLWTNLKKSIACFYKKKKYAMDNPVQLSIYLAHSYNPIDDQKKT